MPALVAPLRGLLAVADAAFASGRMRDAVHAWETLLERAQERSDHAMVVTARVMLARCALLRRELDEARALLRDAGAQVDPSHRDSHGRYRAARARLAREDSPREVALAELLSYLRWAEETGAPEHVVDAALLLADAAWQIEERLGWLQRGVDHALVHGVDGPLAGACNDLGAALDGLGRSEEALEAYEQALVAQRRSGRVRGVIGAAWAVGATALRVEDYALARTRLEEAVALAEEDGTCTDLHALALADLARANDEAGDVVEARRLVVRALALARDQEMERSWPDRWRALVTLARHLELDA